MNNTQHATRNTIPNTQPSTLNSQPADDLGPTIAKAPLRAELKRLELYATIWEEQAAQHQGEAERCRTLGRQAREAADNLRKMACIGERREGEEAA